MINEENEEEIVKKLTVLAEKYVKEVNRIIGKDTDQSIVLDNCTVRISSHTAEYIKLLKKMEGDN